MLLTLLLIVLLASVSSGGCVWEKESEMSVVEQLFRAIFFDPFSKYLYTEPLPESKCESTGTSYIKQWTDALYKSLPSCDCFESSKTIGEEIFRTVFLAPFGLDWKLQKEKKPPEEISYWNYWDDPVFIFLNILLAINLAIIVYTGVQWLKFLVSKEKTRKDVGIQITKEDVGIQVTKEDVDIQKTKTDVGIQVKLTADKGTQTETCSVVRVKICRRGRIVGDFVL